jgi:hypothetical protein
VHLPAEVHLTARGLVDASSHGSRRKGDLAGDDHEHTLAQPLWRGLTPDSTTEVAGSSTHAWILTRVITYQAQDHRADATRRLGVGRQRSDRSTATAEQRSKSATTSHGW